MKSPCSQRLSGIHSDQLLQAGCVFSSQSLHKTTLQWLLPAFGSRNLPLPFPGGAVPRAEHPRSPHLAPRSHPGHHKAPAAPAPPRFPASPVVSPAWDPAGRRAPAGSADSCLQSHKPGWFAQTLHTPGTEQGHRIPADARGVNQQGWSCHQLLRQRICALGAGLCHFPIPRSLASGPEQPWQLQSFCSPSRIAGFQDFTFPQSSPCSARPHCQRSMVI